MSKHQIKNSRRTMAIHDRIPKFPALKLELKRSVKWAGNLLDRTPNPLASELLHTDLPRLGVMTREPRLQMAPHGSAAFSSYELSFGRKFPAPFVRHIPPPFGPGLMGGESANSTSNTAAAISIKNRRGPQLQIKKWRSQNTERTQNVMSFLVCDEVERQSDRRQSLLMQ